MSHAWAERSLSLYTANGDNSPRSQGWQVPWAPDRSKSHAVSVTRNHGIFFTASTGQHLRPQQANCLLLGLEFMAGPDWEKELTGQRKTGCKKPGKIRKKYRGVWQGPEGPTLRPGWHCLCDILWPPHWNLLLTEGRTQGPERLCQSHSLTARVITPISIRASKAREVKWVGLKDLLPGQ